MIRSILALILTLAAAAPLSAQQPPVQTDAGSFSWQYGPFQYDGAGNVMAIGTQTFNYDMTNRLVQSTVERPDLVGAQTQSYQYDQYGNLTSKGSKFFPTDAATNHFTSQNVAYDAAGNVTQWQPAGAVQTYAYDFDGLNALKTITANTTGAKTVVHIYTPADERYWTYASWNDAGTPRELSHWTIRDFDGRVLRDYQFDGSAWTVARDYFYRDSQLLAATTPAGGNLHFSLDHLGTPRVTTNDAGSVVSFDHPLPFGEEWTAPNDPANPQPMTFTGHERDTDPAGTSYPLDYMHARYYNAEWGRFLSVDPVLGDPHDPQSWNRYPYARNNPLRYTDPDGRCTVDGEKHSVIWCVAHALDITQTVHEQAAPRRERMATAVANGTMILRNGERLDPRNMSDREVLDVYAALAQRARNENPFGPAMATIGVALQTLQVIDRTGAAPPGYQGGRQFMNDSRSGGQVLPKTDANGNPITYREWDIYARHPGVPRGAERVVTGSDGSAYYTDNHYTTFVKIR